MRTIYPQITEKMTKTSRKISLFVSLLIFAFFIFAPVAPCFGYVTPDWTAQARANAKQAVKTKPVTVDWAQQKKNNKKQQVKVDKATQKKNNKRQAVKTKPYKYDRQAEIKRNKLQEVK